MTDDGGNVIKIYGNICGLCLAVMLVCPAGGGAEPAVRMGTLDWRPYISQTLENQGYVAEIVREAFRRGGLSVTFSFLPWARAVYMSKSGQLDGYFPEYHAREVEAYAVFSEPFSGGPIGFFKRSDSPVAFETLEDLKPYTIGVVRGYINTEAFDSAAYLRKEPVRDDLSNIRKLLKKRVDLIVCDRFVGLDLLKRHFPDEEGRIEFITPPLAVKELHVCFSKKTPGYEMRVERFNAGLRLMKADGTLDAIMKKHGLRGGL